MGNPRLKGGEKIGARPASVAFWMTCLGATEAGRAPTQRQLIPSAGSRNRLRLPAPSLCRGLQLIAIIFAGHLAAQSPVIHRVSPLAIPAGRTTEVKLVGERLDGITDVWTSLSGVEVVFTNAPTLSLSVPKTAAGIVALRVATTNGASEPAMFMIDDLPTAVEGGTNKSTATAQCLHKPIAVDATTDELAFDYYCFDAKKGETISIEVMASRIGSKLDPVLRIIDARNHEAAFCEDAPGAARDCRLQFRAPASNEYLAEVRDISYQGGAQYYYRLRFGKFPFATCTYPLAASPGTELTVLGPLGERFKPAKLNLLAASSSYGRIGSAFVPLHCDDIPSQYFEREPNDTREQPNQIALPHVINGRFEKAKDRDYFQFDVEKDQRWIFASRTRSLGSPCDAFLELRDADGKVVAASDPSGAMDARLTNQFKESGRYFLVVKELTDRGAPDFAYQIDAKLFEPGFTLAIDDDKIEAKRGGEFNLAVSCARSDFNDKITLEVEGLPEGFAIENATIDAKKTNATIKVKVPENAAAGKLLSLSVFGRAGDKRVKASTMAALRRNFPLLLYPPAELDGVIAVGITSQAPAPESRRKRT